MPITPEQAEPLAELLTTLRPDWTVRRTMTDGLRPLERHPAPLETIAWAAIRYARTPGAETPAGIALNGPHWALADRPDWRPPDPQPILEHDHPWAGPEPMTGIEAFRAAKDKLHADTETGSGSDPVSTVVDEVSP